MRKFALAIGGVIALLAAAGLALWNVPAAQDALLNRALSSAFGAPPERVEHLRVVVCGSASPLGNSMDRAQACVAIVTPDHFFLVDVGARSPVRIAQAQLPMRRLDGVLLTHFHSDHIAALPDINLTSWVQGRSAPLPVYGPVGVHRVIQGFNAAYALDRRYRTAHHGAEILPPEVGPMSAQAFQGPGVVWQDAALTVTAIAVNHSPIEPAVGYRFDYRGRSVVISGDSITHPGLLTASQGVDLMLHDALSRALIDPMIEAARANDVPVLPTIMTDVIDYHADTVKLEAAAKAAGIKTLALYHLVPSPANTLMERIFRRGLSEETHIVSDLDIFELPAGSDVVTYLPAS